MNNEKKKLVIEFDNDKALKQFAKWLCGQGEQDYWTWMECRESEESGKITAIDFDYHNETNQFLPDNTIRTTCGRLDSDDDDDDEE